MRVCVSKMAKKHSYNINFAGKHMCMQKNYSLNLIVQNLTFLHVTELPQMDKWIMRQFLPQNGPNRSYCF